MQNDIGDTVFMGYKLMDEWFRCQKHLSMIQIYGLIFEEEMETI